MISEAAYAVFSPKTGKIIMESISANKEVSKSMFLKSYLGAELRDIAADPRGSLMFNSWEIAEKIGFKIVSVTISYEVEEEKA